MLHYGAVCTILALFICSLLRVNRAWSVHQARPEMASNTRMACDIRIRWVMPCSCWRSVANRDYSRTKNKNINNLDVYCYRFIVHAIAYTSCYAKHFIEVPRGSRLEQVVGTRNNLDFSIWSKCRLNINPQKTKIHLFSVTRSLCAATLNPEVHNRYKIL